MNIDDNERERRKFVGQIILIATVVTYLLNYSRSLILPMFALKVMLLFLGFSMSFAYLRSAEMGLCNIAQGGKWDVDGAGVQDIPDRSLAQEILNKVISMNIGVGVQSIVATGLVILLTFWYDEFGSRIPM